MEVVTDFIKVQKVEQSRITEVDFNNIPFGRVFTDHMLVADYVDGVWQKPEIRPFGKIEVSPCITALHYGQSVFEGMKAFRGPNGTIRMFRPEDNYNRINFSADRLCMPPIPREIFMDGLLKLIDLDRQWVPTNEGSALYIRPLYFATDEYVGIKASDNYKFVIFCCPVGPYYPEPVSLKVSQNYVRAFEGGTGEAKAAGNYAASLKGAQIAKQDGYDNILWLDGKEKKYVEECGTMNVMFVVDGKIITPPLNGTILHGITRDSSLKLLQALGFEVEERMIPIEELWKAYQEGRFTEAFGTGTAATIAHIARIGYEGEDMVFPPVAQRKVGPKLLEKLDRIRKGIEPDPYGWVVSV